MALISAFIAAVCLGQSRDAEFVSSSVEEPAVVFRTARISEPNKTLVEYRIPIGFLPGEQEARVLAREWRWSRQVGGAYPSLLYETVGPAGSLSNSFSVEVDDDPQEDCHFYAFAEPGGLSYLHCDPNLLEQKQTDGGHRWDFDHEKWGSISRSELPIEITESIAAWPSEDRGFYAPPFTSDRCVVVGNGSFWSNVCFLEGRRARIYQRGKRVGFVGGNRIFVKDGDRVWTISPPEGAFAVYDLDVQDSQLLCSFLMKPRLPRKFGGASDWDSPLMYRGRIFLYTLDGSGMTTRELFDGYACRFLGKN